MNKINKKFSLIMLSVVKKSTDRMLCTLVIGLCLSVGSCDKYTTIEDDLSSSTIVRDVTFSKCKGNIINPDSVYITYKDKLLYITHKDIYLNCAFKEIDVTTSINGDTIKINIEENPIDAKCTCPVDISYSVGEFESGTYVINIEHRDKQIYCQTLCF